jgi:hypothetical protein
MAKIGNFQEEAINVLNRGGANDNKSEQKHDSQERQPTVAPPGAKEKVAPTQTRHSACRSRQQHDPLNLLSLGKPAPLLGRLPTNLSQ